MQHWKTVFQWQPHHQPPCLLHKTRIKQHLKINKTLLLFKLSRIICQRSFDSNIYYNVILYYCTTALQLPIELLSINFNLGEQLYKDIQKQGKILKSLTHAPKWSGTDFVPIGTDRALTSTKADCSWVKHTWEMTVKRK